MNRKATSVTQYLRSLEGERKKDVRALHLLIRKTAPQLKPFMISSMQSQIIGYGKMHYEYASGREGDWFWIGLASQKNYISLYFSATKNGKYLAEQMKKQLPKASIGKSCVRFKKNEDIELKIIEKMVTETLKQST